MLTSKSRLVTTASEERSAEYLRTFYNLLQEELSKTKSFIEMPGLSAIVGQTMAVFQRHCNLLLQILKPGKSTFEDLRQTHLNILLRDLDTYEKEWNGISHVPSFAQHWISKVGIILDCLVEYADLLGARPLVVPCKLSSLLEVPHAY